MRERPTYTRPVGSATAAPVGRSGGAESIGEESRGAADSADPLGRAEIPDQRELVAAFGGHRSPLDGHPLIAWARKLAALHRQRHAEPLGAAAIDSRRAELVATIDRWVANLPRRSSTAHLRSEPLGATVDRMAAAHVHASHLLHTVEKVSDDRVHAAWYRLALLADEWTDMVTGVTRARNRVTP